MPDAHAHRGVERVDRVLDLVARSTEPPTLTEISRSLGLPRSTAADVLRELRARGYLRLVGRGHVLGRRLQVLGLLAGSGPPSPVEHDRLEELSRLARAPVASAVLVGGEVLYLDHAGPRAPARLQAVADEHRPRPALRTAAGRLLLAFAGDAERASVLRAVAADDPEAVAAFERERPAIERARLARSDGLADPSIRAIAVPVVEDRQVTAALVLFGPRPRTPGAPAPSAQLALERAAARVAAAL